MELPDGWFYDGDIASYRALVASVPIGGAICEVGSYHGRSLCAVSDIILARRLKVWIVDTFGDVYNGDGGPVEMPKFLQAVKDFGLTDNVVQVKVKRSVEAAKDFAREGRKFDLVFIDADHSLSAVSADIRAYTPLVKHGGILCGHDYPEVNVAVDELCNDPAQMPDRMWVSMPHAKPKMKLLVGIPSSAPGNVCGINLLPLYGNHPDWQIYAHEQAGSSLTGNFNDLWCLALTARDKQRYTHFLMLHSDIKPHGRDWFDLLYNQMLEADAQLISQIVPLKNHQGLTSTAFDTDQWRPTRLMMKQAKALPMTWTCENLLINDGMMLVDLRHEWVEKVYFTVNNRIVKDEEGWHSDFEPEDWHFARQLRRLEVPYYVTRAVTLDHLGFWRWSTKDTGGEEYDKLNAPKVSTKVRIHSADGEERELEISGENDGGRNGHIPEAEREQESALAPELARAV